MVHRTSRAESKPLLICKTLVPCALAFIAPELPLLGHATAAALSDHLHYIVLATLKRLAHRSNASKKLPDSRIKSEIVQSRISTSSKMYEIIYCKSVAKLLFQLQQWCSGG